MKVNKRVLGLCMTGFMALSAAACGTAEEQSVALLYEQPGVVIEYTLEADGDLVHTLTQVSTMDFSMYTEEQIAVVEQSLEQYAAVYEAYESVDHSYVMDEDSLEETIKIDITNKEELKALSEANLIPIEGDSAEISLKKTVENLEGQGWTVKK